MYTVFPTQFYLAFLLCRFISLLYTVYVHRTMFIVFFLGLTGHEVFANHGTPSIQPVKYYFRTFLAFGRLLTLEHVLVEYAHTHSNTHCTVVISVFQTTLTFNTYRTLPWWRRRNYRVCVSSRIRSPMLYIHTVHTYILYLNVYISMLSPHSKV